MRACAVLASPMGADVIVGGANRGNGLTWPWSGSLASGARPLLTRFSFAAVQSVPAAPYFAIGSV
eukprot:612515-Rhodomonas_salina.1